MKIGLFDELKSRIALIVCRFDAIFPPVFFDIMVHLSSHIAYETKLAGPVYYCWMYPIERYGYTSFKYQTFSITTKLDIVC